MFNILTATCTVFLTVVYGAFESVTVLRCLRSYRAIIIIIIIIIIITDASVILSVCLHDKTNKKDGYRQQNVRQR